MRVIRTTAVRDSRLGHARQAPRNVMRSIAVVGILAIGTGCQDPIDAGPDNLTTITVGDNFFRSNHVAVLPGEVVRWNWAGSNQHNVTFDDASIGDSPTQASGTFERTFTAAQSLTTYVYYCTVHGRQQMSGIVEVR